MLDLYLYEEGKSTIFFQILHFSAIRLFNIFWLFTNPVLKQFKRPEKKYFGGGLIFCDSIFACVKKNYSSHLWLILSVQEFFNGHGTFFLIFWLFINFALKKFGRSERKFLWGGLIFPEKIYICVNQKNYCSHLWLTLSVYEFFQRAWYFFQNFPGRQQNFQ